MDNKEKKHIIIRKNNIILFFFCEIKIINQWKIYNNYNIQI